MKQTRTKKYKSNLLNRILLLTINMSNPFMLYIFIIYLFILPTQQSPRAHGRRGVGPPIRRSHYPAETSYIVMILCATTVS